MRMAVPLSSPSTGPVRVTEEASGMARPDPARPGATLRDPARPVMARTPGPRLG